MIKYFRLSQQELEKYCREKRYKRYSKKGPWITRLRGHNCIHYFLVLILKIQRVLNRQRIIIVNDRRSKRNKGIIYACTHIGGNDIESAFEAIKSPCWLLLGDPKEIYRNVEGLMLDLNGVICFDTGEKQDRTIAKERCIVLLKKGGSLLMFPEGAWNISQNQLVMHLFPGAVEMALASGAEIIPIAIARNGKDYYLNIGENISFGGCSYEDKYSLTYKLRDSLATLKWECMEYMPMLIRKELDEDYDKCFLNQIMGTQVATYTVQDVLDTKYKPKDIVEYEQAFDHLGKIKPNKRNLFLLKKIISEKDKFN